MSLYQKYFSNYIQRILVVVSGSAGAQIIGIATYPLISRLFSASEFGILTVFLALSNVGALFGTLRLDQAIVLPEKDSDANALGSATLFVSLLVSLVLVVVYLPLDLVFRFTEEGTVPGIFYLLPLAILLSAQSLALRALTIRSNLFRTISIAATVKAASLVGLILLLNRQLNLSGLNVLILSNVGSIFLELCVMILSLSRARSISISTDWNEIKAVVRHYKKFPIYQLPADFINMAGAQSPTYLLGALYNPALVGYFGMTQRIFGLPVKLVSASTLEVYKRDASIDFRREGNCTSIYLRTLKMLLGLGVVPSLAVSLFGPELFSWVLGEEWVKSGVYAQYLAPMLFLQFAASPLAFTLLIASKHHINFRWQLGLLFATVSGLLLGWALDSSNMSIIGYSAMYCLMYLLSLYLSYNSSKGASNIAF